MEVMGWGWGTTARRAESPLAGITAVMRVDDRRATPVVPPRDEVAIIALNDTVISIEHHTGRRKLGLDKAQGTGVLIGTPI